MSKEARHMPKSWDEKKCNEKSGFLFSHKCELLPMQRCSRCQKPICNQHSHEDTGRGTSIFCTTCIKKFEADNHTDHHRHRHDDPYFYGGYHYGSDYYDGASQSVTDPNDFTDADAESLSAQLASNDFEESFENDMSES